MDSSDRIKILVVDDNAGKRTAIKAMLENPDYSLVTANSGREALRHLLQDEFAVVLLDVNMPAMDGFELAGLIRQRDNTKHTPILFVTSIHTADMDQQRGYALGAVDYLLTPIVPNILRTKVSVFVDLFRQRRELLQLNQQLTGEVAAREQAQEVLRKLNAELKESNETLEESARKLAAANKELDAFSYSVSHDLRAPLRSIDGFSQTLLEDYADKLDEESKDYLLRVRASTQRMGELIDDLLNLSRVTRSEMRRERVDLSAMAQALAVELQKSAPDRRVDFVIADGLSAEGDARLLRIVMDNLLGNAWKYTSKHPRARIEFGIAQNNGQSAYFVRDDGVGFDMAYADKLFGAFQRLHSTHEFSGTGIGLATVQRIMHRHGGRVWAEGNIDEGATFYFTLSS